MNLAGSAVLGLVAVPPMPLNQGSEHAPAGLEAREHPRARGALRQALVAAALFGAVLVGITLMLIAFDDHAIGQAVAARNSPRAAPSCVGK